MGRLVSCQKPSQKATNAGARNRASWFLAYNANDNGRHYIGTLHTYYIYNTYYIGIVPHNIVQYLRTVRAAYLSVPYLYNNKTSLSLSFSDFKDMWYPMEPLRG